MALDVYVGSLTRYYAGDWESIADKKGKRTRPSARAKARATGEPGKDSERIRKAVLTWRDGMEHALRQHLTEPLDWAETTEAPWFTGRPGWDGFGSLVLWAAYAEQPGLRRPAALPEEWDDDPALVRSNADGFRSRYSHLVRNVELWLPYTFEFTFEGEDVDRRRIIVGSSATLGRQLGELNAATWKMDASELTALANDRPSGTGLESCARHGLAVMTGLVQSAVKHGLPMKLDY
ncbi:MAG TPA: hypothetical protein VGM96_23425 [Reyranella sp.]|jgi:hypothetical protein